MRVKDLYERFAYPEPMPDLDAWRRAGGLLYLDPSRHFHLLWPHREIGPLRILSAGCGTCEAAALAYTNRESRVVGIDISATSLRESRRLKDQHGLDNLELRELDVCDARALGQEFDLIVCAGVLHHLPDPVAGAEALRAVLAEGGVMALMLYGRSMRGGVYMLQEAFRALGLEPRAEDLASLRAMLRLVPEDHAVQRYLRNAMDLRYDAGLVDTFLHPQDRAYSVAELFAFLEAAGLAFRGWRDPGQYYAARFLPNDFPLRDRILGLSPEQQAIFIDNFLQLRAQHGFFAGHPGDAGHEIAFDADGWLDWVPIRMEPLWLEKPADAPDELALFQREQVSFALGPADAALLEAVDARRSIRACIAHALGDDPRTAREQGRSFFLDMWRRGHLMFRKPQGAMARRDGS